MNAEEINARLLALLNQKSVRYGAFTLASGATSDFYVDVRQTALHAEGSYLIASLILDRLHEDSLAVGGMTLGADPLTSATTAVGHLTGRPVHGFIVRKQPKAHGQGHGVEGLENLPEGTPVTVLEDTTTTGGSLLKAIERAQQAGLRVVQTLTVVDRQEGASERLAEEGFQLQALATRAQLEAAR